MCHIQLLASLLFVNYQMLLVLVVKPDALFRDINTLVELYIVII